MITMMTLPLKAQLQDQWKFISYAILLLGACAIVYWLPINIDTARGILLGAAGGLLGHYSVTRASKLCVKATALSSSRLEEYLCAMRYVKDKNGTKYVPDLHRLLRFNAQNVAVLKGDDVLTVFGPHYILAKLIKRLSS